jgi:peptidoglycan lytic transglycosylase
MPIRAIAARITPLALAALLFANGCGRHRTVRVPAPPAGPPSPAAARAGDTQTGIASWYGVPYDGRRTASGEIYDMQRLTAAHPTLPFETWVNVTNLSNGKQVQVRINDRGPFVDGRIIDLSLAAAREIDMVRAGLARVRLEVIPPPPQAAAYAVQAGAFSDPDRAETFRTSLPFPETEIVERGDPPLWRVLVGRGLSKQEASDLAVQVEKVAGAAEVVQAPPPTAGTGGRVSSTSDPALTGGACRAHCTTNIR